MKKILLISIYLILLLILCVGGVYVYNNCLKVDDIISTNEEADNNTSNSDDIIGEEVAVTLSAGLYDEYGTQTYTWQELIDDNLITVDGTTFISCDVSLSGQLVISSEITEIAGGSSYESAFYYCTNLTSITIPDSVTTIGNYAFYCCTKLTSITIPDSVTTIGRYAFYDCTGLTSVTIGSGVTVISGYAFYNCSKLTTIIIESEYVYNNLTSTTALGYLGQYATTIKVLKTIVDNESNSNTYLNNESNFTKTTDGDYYVYTAVQ